MIYTEVGGRCGNQLFFYAISRKLETIHEQGITFNYYPVENKAKCDSTWKNNLTSFNVHEYEYISERKNSIYKYGSMIQKIVFIIYSIICKIPYKSRPDLYKRQEFLQPILNRFGIYNMIHGYSPIKKSITKNQFVTGTYEDKRFFDDIKENLYEELTPLYDETYEFDAELLKIIQSNNSICVSFRRGDFTNKENKQIRDICSLEYYKKAINIMREMFPEGIFVFFSDDIEWVKKNCNFNVKAYYESGKGSIASKMKLMSSCSHFIMSNSTFCWWAQYLSKNESKVVISPDRWFNMPGYRHQLIDEEWILIES